MSELTLGVIGVAHKADEMRVPLHPNHLTLLPEDLRGRVFLQRGYGERFGVPDRDLAPHVEDLLSAEEIHERCDVVVIAKPTEADFPLVRPGSILWGWPHCVQGPAITQEAIDKKLTLIAWEAMNLWNGDVRGLHVFHKNNEIAGYAAVMHALTLQGRTGRYGRPLRAAVTGFGLTARGAIGALQGLGINDISCFVRQPTEFLPGEIGGVRYRGYDRTATSRRTFEVESGRAMAEVLADYDLIVNCIFQDTDSPVDFVENRDLGRFRPGTTFVDVSCDAGLGFEFALPTSFREPTFPVGDRLTYYGVDHTPSWLWRSASWEISRAILPFLPVVMAGPAAWDANETIRRAIEIRDGVVLNPKILSFQGRETEYPHRRM